MKIYLVFILVFIHFSLLSQIHIYYNEAIDSIYKKGNYYSTYDKQFWTGVGPNGISILKLNEQNDTSILFTSFGCTQYKIDYSNKAIKLFIWPDNYYSSDCNCIDKDTLPCKPDVKESDLIINVILNPKRNSFEILDFYPKKVWNISIIDKFITDFDTLKIVKLTLFNKLFHKDKYKYTESAMIFYLNNYYALNFILLNQNPNLFKVIRAYWNINISFLHKNNILPNDTSYINYVDKLIEYIWIFNDNKIHDLDFFKFEL